MGDKYQEPEPLVVIYQDWGVFDYNFGSETALTTVHLICIEEQKRQAFGKNKFAWVLYYSEYPSIECPRCKTIMPNNVREFLKQCLKLLGFKLRGHD